MVRNQTGLAWLRRAIVLSACMTGASAQLVSSQIVPNRDKLDGNARSSRPEIVHGVITSRPTGESLFHALVTIDALHLEQLSSTEGKFQFGGIKPGKYAVTVRHLGYRPVTKNVEVIRGTIVGLNIPMDRLSPTITSSQGNEQRECLSPGRPTSADGQPTFEIFEQLEQSAVRARLMALQFPYATVFERRLIQIDTGGTEIAEDPQTFSRPGPFKPLYNSQQVPLRFKGTDNPFAWELPTIVDFTDQKFIANHCFVLRGWEKDQRQASDGASSLLRVDVMAASSLKTVDVEGSVYLDSADYRLRRMDWRLSRPPESIPEVAGIDATITYQDFSPGMPVVGYMEFNTRLQSVNRKPVAVRTWREKQITSRLLFFKQHPDSAPRARK